VQIGHAANRRIGNMNEPVIFPESDALCAMLALPVEDGSYKAAQPDNLTFDHGQLQERGHYAKGRRPPTADRRPPTADRRPLSSGSRS
jgi:hypothetical protein